jgi:hypothetical protein
MAYSVTNTSAGWVSLQFGLPLLLFLVLSAVLLHACAYRFWRLQMLLHRVSERLVFRRSKKDRPSHVGGLPVDARGFDTNHHYHDMRQLAPRLRLALAPVLAFGVVLLLLLPALLLLAWAATLYFGFDLMMMAIAIGLVGACVISLYYALMYWKTGPQPPRPQQQAAQHKLAPTDGRC